MAIGNSATYFHFGEGHGANSAGKRFERRKQRRDKTWKREAEDEAQSKLIEEHEEHMARLALAADEAMSEYEALQNAELRHDVLGQARLCRLSSSGRLIQISSQEGHNVKEYDEPEDDYDPWEWENDPPVVKRTAGAAASFKKRKG